MRPHLGPLLADATTMEMPRRLRIGRYSQAGWEFQPMWQGTREEVRQ
ncbi:hypothetical protein C4K24_3565 [Pseudomonas chlororaphis subsp. aurantiaca]|nr:hypothetical protein C4K24_3565 [Pseudomonas chlororaphis subsp. aurantiaca]